MASSTNTKLTFATALLALIVIVGLAAGWFLNITHLIHSPSVSMWGGKEILQAIGVFIFPLGALMGYVS